MLNKSSIATIGGLIIAIASALVTIDFATFNIHKEWPKIILSAIIAGGGYLVEVKTKKSK